MGASCGIRIPLAAPQQDVPANDLSYGATTLVNITPSQDRGTRSDQKLHRELGEGVLKLLADDRTEDICLGPDCTLWVKQMNQFFESVGNMPPGQAQTALGTIVTMKKTVIRHERPILETELPLDGNSFGGLVSSLVRSSVSAVRLKSRRVFRVKKYEESEITGTSRRRNAIPVVQNGVPRQVLQRIPLRPAYESGPADAKTQIGLH